MKKYFRSLLLMLFPLAGLAANDTTITNDTNIKRKISVGIDVSPFTYSKWSFPENQSIVSANAQEKERDATKRYTAFSFIGFNICYYGTLKSGLFLNFGIYNVSENIHALEIFDTLENKDYIYRDILTYKVSYFEIPVSIGYNLVDNSKRRKFTCFNVSLPYFRTI